MTGIPAAIALLISGPINVGSADGYQDSGGLSGDCGAKLVHFDGRSEGIGPAHVFGHAVLRGGPGESCVCRLPVRQTDVGGDQKVLLRFAVALTSANNHGKGHGQCHQENLLFRHLHNPPPAIDQLVADRERLMETGHPGEAPNSTPKGSTLKRGPFAVRRFIMRERESS